MTVAGLKSCTCPHSMRAHKRGSGRCEVVGCGCLYGPAPVPLTKPSTTARAPSQQSKLEDLVAHRIELAGLPVPTRQYRWATDVKRQYRSDFAWPEARLLVEVQGGIWAADPGRHNRGSGYEADLSRSNLAVLLGYRMLCFSERMIRSGDAVRSITQALGQVQLVHQQRQGAAALAMPGSAASRRVGLDTVE